MPLFLGPNTCITICQKAEKKKISIRILLLFKKILNIINDTTTQHIDFFSREIASGKYSYPLIYIPIGLELVLV